MILYLDLETFSRCDIARCGGYRYAEDDSTEIMLFGYAIGKEPAKVWDLTTGAPMPADLKAAIDNPETTFVAHNSMFDRNVLKAIIGKPFDNPKRWKDTMILAYSVSLPGALGMLSEVLGLPQDKAKDKDGRRLVLKFCKPNAQGKRFTRETSPEDWARFVSYCRLDVEAMREIARRIPKVNDTKDMWEDWACDQTINDRGIPVDTEFVEGAIECAAEVKKAGDESMQVATDDMVGTAMQRDELLRYILIMYGVSLPDLRKSTLERRVDDENLPDEVRRLIALRLASAVASVAKYKALDRATCADGRLRGATQFMGAARTGRFAGRIFQPQNLPRGTLKPDEVEQAIDAVKGGIATSIYDNVNRVLSSCIRGCVAATPGHKLVVADLSNIEGRVLAWLAGEEWKIKAFEAYDRGEGPDLYKATYARTFGIKAEDVTKNQRQIGKVLELGLGYQGGVGAFLTFAPAYGVDLNALADHVYEAIDHRYIQLSTTAYEWALEKKMTHGLSQKTWIACNAIKCAWREAHPAVCKLWQDAEDVMRGTLETGTEQMLGTRVKVNRAFKNWLALRLPSGRHVMYPAACVPQPGMGCALTFAGIDQYTRKWCRVKTYGGRLVENITQAVARDVLMAGLRHAEDMGMRPVMHIHDEIVCEVPDYLGATEEDLVRCMTEDIPWTSGLPLAAAGFTSHRYKKD